MFTELRENENAANSIWANGIDIDVPRLEDEILN